MELNDYQKKAMQTCMPSSDNFSYMMLNLVGEVGEFASKVAKAIRKNELEIGEFPVYHALTNSSNIAKNHVSMYGFDIDDEEFQKEAGDIMWQIAGLCNVLGWNLEDICQQNLDKLASRQQRGVIDGNGDNR